MKAKISMVTLAVENLNASTQFYQQGLQLPLTDFSNEHISFFSLESTWLALYPKEALLADIGLEVGEVASGVVTLAHNVTSQDLVIEVMAAAKKAGAKVLKPAQDTFWGGFSGYFADLDGHVWEVAWNPHFDLS